MPRTAHILPILLPIGTEREHFMSRMKEYGVQTSIHYPPIHTFTSYRNGSPIELPVTEDVASREVTLPLYPTLSEEDVMYIVDAIRRSIS